MGRLPAVLPLLIPTLLTTAITRENALEAEVLEGSAGVGVCSPEGCVEYAPAESPAGKIVLIEIIDKYYHARAGCWPVLALR